MKILDACCGSKMFWFDREHKETVYMDTRTLDTTLCDGRKLIHLYWLEIPMKVDGETIFCTF